MDNTGFFTSFDDGAMKKATIYRGGGRRRNEHFYVLLHNA